MQSRLIRHTPHLVRYGLDGGFCAAPQLRRPFSLPCGIGLRPSDGTVIITPGQQGERGSLHPQVHVAKEAPKAGKTWTGGLYQISLITTHRDGFPRFSARSVWRGDAGHREPRATPSESLGKPPSVARANRRGRRQALTMPHIACGFPPARRIARTISMGRYQRDLVLLHDNEAAFNRSLVETCLSRQNLELELIA
jgi:hypothetical protein